MQQILLVQSSANHRRARGLCTVRTSHSPAPNEQHSSPRPGVPYADDVGQEVRMLGCISHCISTQCICLLWDGGCISHVWPHTSENRTCPKAQNHNPLAHRGLLKQKALAFYFPELERERVYCFLLPLPPPRATNPPSGTHILLLP